jgi:hypothetical protein
MVMFRISIFKKNLMKHLTKVSIGNMVSILYQEMTHLSWPWWCTSIIPATQKVKVGSPSKVEASLGKSTRPYLKTN